MSTVEIVTPNEIAATLGVSGLKFRNWLRAERKAGHPPLGNHEHRGRWQFTRREADQLVAEYRASAGRVSPQASSSTFGGATATAASKPPAARRTAAPAPSAATPLDVDSIDGHPLSADAGHRMTEEWMGECVWTLADLLRPGLKAVVIGINPSPVSVACGHYYQGVVGQRFFGRLAHVGVIDPSAPGWEDDAAYAAGIGFTDCVKRPTSRANGLRPGELEHGREQLEAKLGDLGVRRVLFTFKRAATSLLGPFDGHGLLANVTLAGAEVFVMPGPMENSERVERVLQALRTWWLD